MTIYVFKVIASSRRSNCLSSLRSILKVIYNKYIFTMTKPLKAVMSSDSKVTGYKMEE
jgi:hypothetical protein